MGLGGIEYCMVDFHIARIVVRKVYRPLSKFGGGHDRILKSNEAPC